MASVLMTTSERRSYPFAEIIEDLDLNKSLVVEPLFVADDFDCDRFTGAVITTMENLAKRSLAESIYNFVSIGEMVMVDHKIIASFVIVAIVVDRVVQYRWLLPAACADAID